MTHRGLPDNPRSSRHILKDFVNGKLLYCVPPPDVDPFGFQEYNLQGRVTKTAAVPTPFQLRVTKVIYGHSLLLSQLFLQHSFDFFFLLDKLRQCPVGRSGLLHANDFDSSQ